MFENWRWLGHVRGTILRPSVQRYPEETVSRDVGTEGAAHSRVTRSSITGAISA